MKPAWDKLIEEFNTADYNNGGFVADVDCTAEGKPLCSRFGVGGYPTIKYGDPNNLEDYSGGRDFDSLLAFAKENLKPMCGPANIDICDDAKKAEIQELQKLSDEELNSQIEAKEGEISAAEKTFETDVAALQAKYKELQETKDSTIAAVKASGLGMMKSVKANRGSSADPAPESLLEKISSRVGAGADMAIELLRNVAARIPLLGEKKEL